MATRHTSPGLALGALTFAESGPRESRSAAAVLGSLVPLQGGQLGVARLGDGRAASGFRPVVRKAPNAAPSVESAAAHPSPSPFDNLFASLEPSDGWVPSPCSAERAAESLSRARSVVVSVEGPVDRPLPADAIVSATHQVAALLQGGKKVVLVVPPEMYAVAQGSLRKVLATHGVVPAGAPLLMIKTVVNALPDVVGGARGFNRYTEEAQLDLKMAVPDVVVRYGVGCAPATPVLSPAANPVGHSPPADRASKYPRPTELAGAEDAPRVGAPKSGFAGPAVTAEFLSRQGLGFANPQDSSAAWLPGQVAYNRRSSR